MQDTPTSYELTISGGGYAVSISEAATKGRDRIVEASKRIVAVTDPDSLSLAQRAMKALAGIRISVDKSREKAKKPILEAGRFVDGLAKDFVGVVITEEARLSGLVNEHVREEQRKAREAAEAAERERRRIEQEEHERRMAALRAEQEAERQRMEAERKKHEAEIAALRAQQAEDHAKAEEERRRAEQAAAAQREAAERAEAARIQAEEAARQAAAQQAQLVQAPVELPDGVKEEVDFEVVDALEFVNAFPQLVTIIPKRAEIIAALKKSHAKRGSWPDVPGLRIFTNLKVRGR